MAFGVAPDARPTHVPEGIAAVTVAIRCQTMKAETSFLWNVTRRARLHRKRARLVSNSPRTALSELLTMGFDGGVPWGNGNHCHLHASNDRSLDSCRSSGNLTNRAKRRLQDTK